MRLYKRKMEKREVILGLGSNVGNRREMLRLAISELTRNLENIRVSHIFESAALLPDGAPPGWNMPYYNMAVVGKTSLSPQELLTTIKQIESKLGRKKAGHWSPREIDIDILGMEDLVFDSDDLTIPHKELTKRNFVLIGMAEIVPDWLHPIARKTAKELAKGVPLTGLAMIKRPELVGIINITPDSFSDGGENFIPQDALNNILRLVDEGGDIIDIGAESTRPNAAAVTQEEEWARLEPVLSRLEGFPIPISVDTRYAQTAKKALALGARWINDVSGFANYDMVAAVRDSNCNLVVMHSLTVPADKSVVLPIDADPVELVLSWAKTRILELEKAGIKSERIIFDPGIGFGKNAEQSQAIIDGITRFSELDVPILIGHSRKSFLKNCHPELAEGSLRDKDKSKDISHSFDMTINNKDDATIKISQLLAENGVDYLRVHNVKRHRLEVL